MAPSHLAHVGLGIQQKLFRSVADSQRPQRSADDLSGSQPRNVRELVFLARGVVEEAVELVEGRVIQNDHTVAPGNNRALQRCSAVCEIGQLQTSPTKALPARNAIWKAASPLCPLKCHLCSESKNSCRTAKYALGGGGNVR
jgi:hypothetical protein